MVNPIDWKDTFDRIMNMTDADVQSILGPMLTSDEVRATVMCLQGVEVHLAELEKAGLVLNSSAIAD